MQCFKRHVGSLYPRYPVSRISTRTVCYLFPTRPQLTVCPVHKRLKALPFLGSFHASDVFLNAYLPGGDMQDYIIRFVSKLDPNGNTGITWPKYTKESPKMLSFNDGLTPLTVTEDTYRKDQMNTLNKILLANPI